MKLLPAPYGWPQGVNIQLHARGPVRVEPLLDALLEVSCYPPIIPKLVQCLRVSGRYDCRVQDCVVRNLDLPVILDEVGIDLVVDLEQPLEGEPYRSREIHSREEILNWPHMRELRESLLARIENP